MGKKSTQIDRKGPHVAAAQAAEIINPAGRHEIVLVCEHASPFIPDEYSQLGISEDIAHSHVAWDPGAGDTAAALSALIDAVLVRGTVSRLIYDCNRPPEAGDAIRRRTELGSIPGNIGLSAAEVATRVSRYYRPFQQALADTLARHRAAPILVTIHSFTPVLDGQTRDVEVGILHDVDARLADAVLSVARRSSDGFNVQCNEPYGPDDGVTHTLREHGIRHGLLNVMIEIRNDLLVTPEQCNEMAVRLKSWLEMALATIRANSVFEAQA